MELAEPIRLAAFRLRTLAAARSQPTLATSSTLAAHDVAMATRLNQLKRVNGCDDWRMRRTLVSSSLPRAIAITGGGSQLATFWRDARVHQRGGIRGSLRRRPRTTSSHARSRSTCHTLLSEPYERVEPEKARAN